MSVDTREAAEILGALSLGLNDITTRFIFELMVALNKGNLVKAQDLAKGIEVDLKKADIDLTDLSRVLDIQPTHNGTKVLMEGE